MKTTQKRSVMSEALIFGIFFISCAYLISTTLNKGKPPADEPELSEMSTEQLHEKLAEYIRDEDYANCVIVRDLIKSRKKKLIS